MIPLALAFRGLARAIGAVWRDPETKALPLVAGALVLTIVYILTGFGVLVALLTSVAEKYIEQKAERGEGRGRGRIRARRGRHAPAEDDGPQ